MLFVDNQNNNDPQINLALEEFLLRYVDVAEPMLLFYINAPSVIIGRNQNTLEEIDPDFVELQGIHVVRRLSGGGAVYHDLGNLNFSFITKGRGDLHDFGKFTGPVIDSLEKLGVHAERHGRSDLFVGSKKISGNAQYASSGRMFSHGTLLFDTDIEQMLRALNPQKRQIESKAVQSVRNFVTNIREMLPSGMDIHQLQQAILEEVFHQGQIKTFDLKESDWARIRQIKDDRYGTWEWNVGRSPRFNVQKSEQTAAGKIDVRVDVDQSLIQGIKFYGSFAGNQDVVDLETRLVGVRYERESLSRILEGIDLSPYFGKISASELVELIY